MYGPQDYIPPAPLAGIRLDTPKELVRGIILEYVPVVQQPSLSVEENIVMCVVGLRSTSLDVPKDYLVIIYVRQVTVIGGAYASGVSLTHGIPTIYGHLLLGHQKVILHQRMSVHVMPLVPYVSLHLSGMTTSVSRESMSRG